MMEHLKVYPFTVSLPRYASWRKYAQALLKQLKACPACRGAADGFPVSILPKTHKLPNGKLLVFKGLTAATDQGALCTNNEVVEEYDMVSIDPNCPRHGKYSRTAWLSKQGTRSGRVKIRPRQQVVSTAKNQNQQNAINHKTDGVSRMFSSSLCKPDTKPDLVLKERGRENFEPNGQTQYVPSTETVAARKDLKYMSSVLVQKQLNIPSVRDQEKDFVSRKHSVARSIERAGPLDSQRNEMTQEFGREFRSTQALECEKDVLKCEESYASQFRRMCLLKKTCDTDHEKTEAQDKKLLERVAKMDSSFQSTSVDVPSHRVNDHIADGCSTCSTTRVPQKEEPLATHKLEELQQTSDLVERLNKIANAARALQAELEDHQVDKGTRVQLAQARVVNKQDTRQWMLDTAIEKAVNKIPGDHEGRRVRHLVQAFESIKVALLQH